MNQSKIRYFGELVKNNLVQIDPFWERECFAVNIQFLFPDFILEEFSRLQEQLLKNTGEILRKCPRESLHLSVAFIIGVKQEYSLDRRSLWAEIGSRCENKVKRVAGRQRPFDIVFNKLTATDTAIILTAIDKGEMKGLRKDIMENVPIPFETLNMSEIIHTTLFRYSGRLKSPDRILERTAAWNGCIPVRIDEISIIKELVYPSLKVDVINTFKFSGQ